MNCESVITVHLISVKTAPINIEKIMSILFHFAVWNALDAVKTKHEFNHPYVNVYGSVIYLEIAVL